VAGPELGRDKLYELLSAGELRVIERAFTVPSFRTMLPAVDVEPVLNPPDPLIIPLQAKLPVEFVTVQPVPLAVPPPSSIFPVEVPAILTNPDVEALRLRFWAVPPAATDRAPEEVTTGELILVATVTVPVKLAVAEIVWLL